MISSTLATNSLPNNPSTMPSTTNTTNTLSSSSSSSSGLTWYYKKKISDLEFLAGEKQINLRRLEAQRNALNSSVRRMYRLAN
jgi:myo-inositol-hexaphosphate 3-phosphohydrolase